MAVLRSCLCICIFLTTIAFATAIYAQNSGETYRVQSEKFRQDRARSLQAPEGWLSLIGLEWLKAGVNTVGSAPDNTAHLPIGLPTHLALIKQSRSGEKTELLIAPPRGGYPKDFKIDGKPVTDAKLGESSKLTFGTYTIVPIERGDKVGLRIKDLNAPTRLHFHGLNWFPISETYRTTAEWTPYKEPHSVSIPTIIGTTLHEKVPGVAAFSLDGKQLRLEPIVEGDKLFFILRDVTSRTTTYQASRFLYTDFPTSGLGKAGKVTLDFNQLINPPCAYTAYATCALPPPQNQLSVTITAGEKRYHP